MRNYIESFFSNLILICLCQLSVGLLIVIMIIAVVVLIEIRLFMLGNMLCVSCISVVVRIHRIIALVSIIVKLMLALHVGKSSRDSVGILILSILVLSHVIELMVL